MYWSLNSVVVKVFTKGLTQAFTGNIRKASIASRVPGTYKMNEKSENIAMVIEERKLVKIVVPSLAATWFALLVAVAFI